MYKIHIQQKCIYSQGPFQPDVGKAPASGQLTLRVAREFFSLIFYFIFHWHLLCMHREVVKLIIASESANDLNWALYTANKSA